MKEHHQAILALLLTVGEFAGATLLVIQDGHFFALYLAFTYLMRETPGGKQYHELIQKGLSHVLSKPKGAEPPTVPDLHTVHRNPF